MIVTNTMKFVGWGGAETQDKLSINIFFGQQSKIEIFLLEHPQLLKVF